MALWLLLCKQTLDIQIPRAIGSNLIHSFIDTLPSPSDFGKIWIEILPTMPVKPENELPSSNSVL